MSENPKPDLTKPLDIKAFLYNELGMCACIEFAPTLETIRDFLIWSADNKTPGNRYNDLFGGHVGTFYMIAMALDRAGLLEHGTSMRFPWLTQMGEDLLNGLRHNFFDDIESASGTAYDGELYTNPDGSISDGH